MNNNPILSLKTTGAQVKGNRPPCKRPFLAPLSHICRLCFTVSIYMIHWSIFPRLSPTLSLSHTHTNTSGMPTTHVLFSCWKIITKLWYVWLIAHDMYEDICNAYPLKLKSCINLQCCIYMEGNAWPTYKPGKIKKGKRSWAERRVLVLVLVLVLASHTIFSSRD